jgi:dihydrodipicolinate synthase/N-acetylneuraminate lyase
MQASQQLRRVRPGRTIEGISAVLLPFDAAGSIDLDSFAPNVERTLRAGIVPAVNMDTGYTNLITPQQRREVLRTTREVVQGRKFVAGAFIEGETGDVTTLYKRAVAEIIEHGGTPILFQSSALKALNNKAKVAVYREVAGECEAMLAFELGEMFAPFGQIYDLDTMRELMQIPQLKGAKHSSLNRELEWQRLALRDEVRPDFKIYTGNDLAIDMVCYGSDYLLGLSAFSPEAFALRDRLWQADDSRFYGLNDLLQYLGFFAFRPPVPAYKHNAAQFLALRGRIATHTPHPRAASRPDSDIEVLQDISRRLDEMLDGMSEPLPELASQEAML